MIAAVRLDASGSGSIGWTMLARVQGMGCLDGQRRGWSRGWVRWSPLSPPPMVSIRVLEIACLRSVSRSLCPIGTPSSPLDRHVIVTGSQQTTASGSGQAHPSHRAEASGGRPGGAALSRRSRIRRHTPWTNLAVTTIKAPPAGRRSDRDRCPWRAEGRGRPAAAGRRTRGPPETGR